MLDEFLKLSYKIDHSNSRTPTGIRQRFKATISAKVSKFLSVLKSIKSTEISGYTEKDYCEDATEDYYGKYGERFKFGHCLEELAKLPKFNLDSMINNNKKSKNTNDVMNVIGSNLEQLIGTK